MRVRWTTDAADDLERICDSVARERPEAARRLALDILDPRLLISGPFKTCPHCGAEEFGILGVGHEMYTRRCRARSANRDTDTVGSWRVPRLRWESSSGRGETVLVGDEAAERLWRRIVGCPPSCEFVTRERQVLYVFPATGSETATGIALHPKTGELYFVAGALYRMDLKTNKPRRVDVERLPRRETSRSP